MTRQQFERARERVLSALEKSNARYKFRELAKLVGGVEQANEVIAQLRKEGRQICYGKADHRYYLSRIPTPYSNYFDMTWIPQTGKIGLISDTHQCSEAERPDLLEFAYDEFVRQGVTTVLHCGDISDGFEVYKGHQQHVKIIGVQRQAAYVIANYPRRDGVKTFFISGNHDNRAFEKQGIDVCSLIVNGLELNGKHIDGREDMVYLGQYSRLLLFPQNITCQLLHPMGGSVYALSYPQQKRARESRKDTFPDIQVSGHFHQFCWIMQDSCQMIALPGVQDETEFFVRMGYGRQIGFCIADYKFKEGWVASFKVELFRLN